MRISDWSSDVCSSDLVGLDQAAALPDLQQVAHRLDAVLALGQVQFLRRQQLFERSERVLAVELGIGRIPQFALARGASAILEATTAGDIRERGLRSAEHTSERQSIMPSSYAVFCLKQKNLYTTNSY